MNTKSIKFFYWKSISKWQQESNVNMSFCCVVQNLDTQTVQTDSADTGGASERTECNKARDKHVNCTVFVCSVTTHCLHWCVHWNAFYVNHGECMRSAFDCAAVAAAAAVFAAACICVLYSFCK